MSDVKNCTTCTEAIFCSSWDRYRCKIRKIRIRPDDNECAYCGLYKKGKPDNDCRCKVCEERSKEDD